MLKRARITASIMMPLLLACDAGSPVSPLIGTPSFAPAGTDNKEVITVDDPPFTFECDGGAVLTGQLSGWFQLMGGQGGNLELNVFHLLFTFTNPATGQTFLFRDIGPDRVFERDGDLYIAITGRSTASGVIGHVVFNLTTEEVVLVAGKSFGDVFVLACETLT
jgi:hypothetical protein